MLSRLPGIMLLLWLCCSMPALAQNRDITFEGRLQMDGQQVSYRIVFREQSNGSISGYSITDVGGPSEIKAAITGRWQQGRSRLFIRETRVISSRMDMSNTVFCFMSATMTASARQGRQLLSGRFDGRTPENAPCAAGTMSLLGAAVPPPPARPRPAPRPQPGPPPPPPVIVDTPAPPPPPPPLPVQHPSDRTRAYVWKSTELGITIWDGFKPDGDIISLELNGRVILDHHTLTEARKTLSVPLSIRGVDTLYIITHNAGNDPPNTPNITLSDGETRYELSVNGEPGGRYKIYLRRE